MGVLSVARVYGRLVTLTTVSLSPPSYIYLVSLAPLFLFLFLTPSLLLLYLCSHLTLLKRACKDTAVVNFRLVKIYITTNNQDTL